MRISKYCTKEIRHQAIGFNIGLPNLRSESNFFEIFGAKVIKWRLKRTFAAQNSNRVPEVVEKVIVPVPCAIIEQDGRILVAQRNALGSLPLKWEFPGGKLEEGESDEEGLSREIREELSVNIIIKIRLTPTSRDDGWREIVLIPFVCSLPSGEDIFLTEHEQMAWLSREEFYSVDWAEADRRVVKTYENYLDGRL